MTGTVLGLALLLLIAVGCVLYVPALRKATLEKGLSVAREQTGMDIDLDDIYLSPFHHSPLTIYNAYKGKADLPLEVRIDSLFAGHRGQDTLICVQSLRLNAKLLTAQRSDSETVQQRSGLKVTCLPTRHFSNRLLGGRNQTLWAAFMVEDAGRKVYVGGDGGYDGRFKRVREQFGQVDLALLENGQYNNDWPLIHSMPEGLEGAIRDLQAKAVFTVHHDKFALSKYKLIKVVLEYR